MAMGFADLQRVYADHQVVTYPLKQDKAPAIRGYDRVGAKGSQQLAIKFPEATACGFIAGRRNGLTVVDIDSPDDRLVDDRPATVSLPSRCLRLQEAATFIIGIVVSPGGFGRCRKSTSWAGAMSWRPCQ